MNSFINLKIVRVNGCEAIIKFTAHQKMSDFKYTNPTKQNNDKPLKLRQYKSNRRILKMHS